jgi:hypothetical protein
MKVLFIHKKNRFYVHFVEKDLLDLIIVKVMNSLFIKENPLYVHIVVQDLRQINLKKNMNHIFMKIKNLLFVHFVDINLVEN